jgi:arylsulfatase A-like enzyme
MLYGWPDLQRPLRTARGLAGSAYYDVVYVICVTSVFALALLLAGRRPRVRAFLHGIFRGVALFSVLLSLINIRALAELDRPLSYQWLYYSHFFRSLDTYNALATVVSWTWPVEALAVCALMLFAEFLAARVLVNTVNRRSKRAVLVGSALTIGFYLTLGPRWVARTGVDLTHMQNPVVALLGSALHAGDSPVLARTPTPVGPEDFLTAEERAARSGSGTHAEGHARASSGVRNVVILVMESVAAQYVGPYGANYGVTPEFDSLSHSGRLYTSVYAHSPSTTNSLLALLLSIYPWHTFRPITRVYPTVPLPSLSGELKRQGYRTGFFNGEDNRFQRAGEFLAGRFDVVTDYKDFPCNDQDLAASGNDYCAVKTFEKWLDSSPNCPFLAVLWTAQTHWPYLVTTRARVSQTGDTMSTRFQRYLAALSDGDRALGDILRLLERRHLADSTLVVVLGDHGEAFGQHGHEVHRDLYEEEVHIPLLFINRRLFRDETDSTVAGMVDIAPTIMDLLGFAIPGSWQGRSLLDTQRSGRAYLFAPYSGLFGYREGDRMLILDDASRKPPQLYDLRDDPQERRNIASTAPDVVRRGRERLAAWVQYQDRFFDRLFAAAGR